MNDNRASINLNRLAYFAAVVDGGSFTRAAERLGVTKAVVSQQVARLEQDVGITLLLRTTRTVTPTEAGQALHTRCARMLGEADEAFAELAQSAAEPTGTLRITAPNDYGNSAVVPVLVAFRRRHPSCKVQLSLSDRRAEMNTGAWDVAIRLGWLTDSSLRARRIGTFRQVLVAAPALAQPLSGPDALHQLPFVANAALNEPLRWAFTRRAPGNAERCEVALQSSFAVDATPALLGAICQGAGFGVVPDYLAQAELDSGRLVELLPEWALPEGGIFAVYPGARFKPSKVTTFVDMLQAHSTRASGPGMAAAAD